MGRTPHCAPVVRRGTREKYSGCTLVHNDAWGCISRGVRGFPHRCPLATHNLVARNLDPNPSEIRTTRGVRRGRNDNRDGAHRRRRRDAAADRATVVPGRTSRRNPRGVGAVRVAIGPRRATTSGRARAVDPISRRRHPGVHRSAHPPARGVVTVVSFLVQLPRPPRPGSSERVFSDRVAALARHPAFGWRVAHFGTAMRGDRYVTPVVYDGAGFPDLVLVNPRRGLVWFRELKVRHQPLQLNQRDWYADLVAAGANVDVWRPEDWPDIVAALSNGRARVGAGG